MDILDALLGRMDWSLEVRDAAAAEIVRLRKHAQALERENDRLSQMLNAGAKPDRQEDSC